MVTLKVVTLKVVVVMKQTKYSRRAGERDSAATIWFHEVLEFCLLFLTYFHQYSHCIVFVFIVYLKCYVW